MLEEHGAVSPQVAQAMAQGARRSLGCDLAVSATGVAGPGPDERSNPVGLVYLGLAWEGGCYVKEFRAGNVSRERVRRQSAQQGLDLVRRKLTGLL